MMMQSMAAMAAEYHVNQYKMHYVRNAAVGKTDEMAWDKLTNFLDQFAIVATMRRFDESLLMAHDQVRPLSLTQHLLPHQPTLLGRNPPDPTSTP